MASNLEYKKNTNSDQPYVNEWMIKLKNAIANRLQITAHFNENAVETTNLSL